MRLNKLTALQVTRARPYPAGSLTKKGKPRRSLAKRCGDGGGLQLIVEPAPDGSLNRKFVFRFTWHGKPNEMGMAVTVRP